MPEVTISGTLLGANSFQNNGANGLSVSDIWPFDSPVSCYCMWEIIAPSEAWAVVQGESTGQTQVAVSEGDDLAKCQWNHPLEVTYSTTSLRGWPSLCVVVWTQDQYGRNEISGYGCTRIPPQPGMHELEIPTWIPEGSFKERLVRKFIGGGPQLLDSTIVLNPGSNKSALQTSSSGSVNVEINCLFRGFSEHGIVFNYNAEKQNADMSVQRTYSSIYKGAAPSAFGSTVGDLSNKVRTTRPEDDVPELEVFGRRWYNPEQQGY